MKALFLKRRQDFQKQQNKYLRYVLNDHFVLVLMFLLGFAMVQYGQLLNHFPTNQLKGCVVDVRGNNHVKLTQA